MLDNMQVRRQNNDETPSNISCPVGLSLCSEINTYKCQKYTERMTETDRQTQTQTQTQTDRHADRQRQRQTERETER